MRRILIPALLLLLALPAGAGEMTVSQQRLWNVSLGNVRSSLWLAGHCANPAPASPSPANGEECTDGDHFKAIDVRGYTHVAIYFKCPTVTCDLEVWNCIWGTNKSIVGATDPSTQDVDANSAQTEMCQPLEEGAGVTLDGLAGGVQLFTLQTPAAYLKLLMRDCGGTSPSSCAAQAWVLASQ